MTAVMASMADGCFQRGRSVVNSGRRGEGERAGVAAERGGCTNPWRDSIMNGCFASWLRGEHPITGGTMTGLREGTGAIVDDEGAQAERWRSGRFGTDGGLNPRYGTSTERVDSVVRAQ